MTSNKRKRQKKTQAKRTSAPTRTVDAASASKPKTRRIWLFRLTSLIAVPLLLFSLLEIGLRVAGYGFQPDFYIKSETSGDYRTNNRFGLRFFPSALARSPVPHFLEKKTDGTIRIFVLGGSAAQGIPEPAFSFGRILEAMLQARHPGVKFEVANAAMTAINSHVVLEIARDCSRFQPDLFIVYMGNNEVIGPFGPGTVFSKLSSNWYLIRANLWVKSTRTGQLLGNAIGSLYPQSGSKVWLGMEMFTSNPVPADDPRLEAVYKNFHKNLDAICEAGRNSGAGVVLSTVAVNLEDCPPFASRHRADMTDSELGEWDSIYGAGKERENGKEWMEALAAYEKAAQLDDRYAELQFRMGTCLRELGRFAEARERFLSACDLDILRFRADRKINAIVREVASTRKGDGVDLVDTERFLTQENAVSNGIPGNDFFFEHVHFTFDGNYRLARMILNQVEKSIPQIASSGDPGPMPSEKQCAQALTMTSWDEYKSLGEIVKVVSRPPFTNQQDHSARLSAMKKQYRNLARWIFLPENYRDSCNTYEAALGKKPDDWGLQYRFGKLLLEHGEFERAADHFNAALKIYPWNEGLYDDLGYSEFRNGHIEKAVSYFKKALLIHPGDLAANSNLVLALAGQGRFDEAEAHFREAVDVDPNYEQAYINMGTVLGRQGNLEQATALFKKALEINPENPVAWYNLGTTLVAKLQIGEAVENFRKAIEFDPNYEDAYINLGSALISRGDIEGGIGYYRKALEINPRNATTYYRMASAESIRGRLDRAVGFYREAIQINPRLVEAHLDLGNVLGSQGKIEEAALQAQKALEIDPQNEMAYFLLGNLFAIQGKTEKAVDNYREALKINPEFEEARKALQSLQ